MSKHCRFLLAIVLSAAFASCGVAEAAEWTVAKLSGHVVIQSGPVQTIALNNGMVLKSGSVLVADKTGRALLVHGGDQMIVSPNSIIAVPKDGAGMTTVLQRLGEIEFDVAHKSAPHFTVATPFLAAIVKGTHFKVRVFRKGASVMVQRGRVEVDDLITGEKVDVLPGQTALVKPGEHLMIAGPGMRSPILQAKPWSNPFGSGGSGDTANIGSGGFGASSGRGSGVSAGGGGVSASLGGGAVSASLGSGGSAASVGGRNGASVSAGGGGVGVSAAGGAVSASVGASGAQVSVGGISVGLHR